MRKFFGMGVVFALGVASGLTYVSHRSDWGDPAAQEDRHAADVRESDDSAEIAPSGSGTPATSAEVSREAFLQDGGLETPILGSHKAEPRVPSAATLDEREHEQSVLALQDERSILENLPEDFASMETGDTPVE